MLYKTDNCEIKTLFKRHTLSNHALQLLLKLKRTFAGQNSVSICLKEKILEKREMLNREMCGFWRPKHSTNPTKSARGSRLCLYFTSFFAPSCTSPLFPPKVPDFTSFFATRFAAVQLRSEGILTNGQTDTGQRQYRPSHQKLLP